MCIRDRWGTPVDTTLFNIQTDWAQLYQSAKVQALLGITFDGMQTLPQELRPKREDVYKRQPIHRLILFLGNSILSLFSPLTYY